MEAQQQTEPAIKYDFVCDERDCRHSGDVVIPTSELYDYRECPNCGVPGYSHRWSGKSNIAFIPPEKLGRMKAPGDFRNMLSQIAKAHPGNAIKQR